MDNSQHWYDFDMMRAPGVVRLALEWRFAVRAALEPLLASDWVVTGFDPTTGYHLERNPDAAA